MSNYSPFVIKWRTYERYALALLTDDEKIVNELKNALLEGGGGPVAFYYGFHMKEDRGIPLFCRGDEVRTLFYLKGLVSADSLEFYVAASFSVDQGLVAKHRRSIYESAGTFCAKRMMDYFGYGQIPLQSYFRGLCTDNQLETLAYLAERLGRKVFENAFKDVFLRSMRFGSNTYLTEVSLPYLLARCLITLSEEEWKQIEMCNRSLFAKLQCDV